MKHIKFLYFFACFTAIITGCAKFVEIAPPVNAITDETAYRTDATATSVLTGLFQIINSSGPFSTTGSGLSIYAGLQADELKYYLSTVQTVEFSTNALRADNAGVLAIWTRAYRVIYGANAAIEGITKSSTLSPAVRDQLIGEAKFVRAFMFFYLVNLYGKVPIPLTTNYQQNILLPREAVTSVYQQITTDLKAAQTLLKDEYLSATNAVTTDRVRPNKAAATALLARTYLYLEDWANAEINATAVINRSAVYKMERDLNKIFLVASPEAIWQLGMAPNISGANTFEGYAYTITANPTTSSPGLSLTGSLMSVLNGDKRLTNWTKNFTVGTTNYPYAYKYKVKQAASNSAITEHFMVLRLAEQYLIRAEARAMLGKLTGTDGAVADLNVVRDRSDQTGAAPVDLYSFMIALEKERQLELFTEWGHRWFDIKRWKGFINSAMTRADEIMPAIATAKGGAWKPEYKLWPIPESEISANINLDPNPGYGF